MLLSASCSDTHQTTGLPQSSATKDATPVTLKWSLEFTRRRVSLKQSSAAKNLGLRLFRRKNTNGLGIVEEPNKAEYGQ